MDIFTTISYTYFKIPKREPTSFNKLYCALSLKFMNLLQHFHLAVIEYLYRRRRAVPLQTFTTRHSNRKLSIVMALSTTFTQFASETTKFGKIRHNKGHFAVRGHSKPPILVPMESSYTTSHQWLILIYRVPAILPPSRSRLVRLCRRQFIMQTERSPLFTTLWAWRSASRGFVCDRYETFRTS